MTFHNGGYECERKVMNLSKKMKKDIGHGFII